MYLVSACLCGLNCRYDGKNCLNTKVKKLFDKGLCIPVCPESLGGLSIPREPHEIDNKNGKEVLTGGVSVLSQSGVDNTKKFVLGANKVLSIAKSLNIDTVILKAKSPSCGFGQIYDGSFQGRLINGNGVTAELLHQNGITILTENDF